MRKDRSTKRKAPTTNKQALMMVKDKSTIAILKSLLRVRKKQTLNTLTPTFSQLPPINAQKPTTHTRKTQK